MTVTLPLAQELRAPLPGTAEGEEALVAYAYSYPHKSSYRPLVPSVPLVDAWKHEDRGALALYVHIPFCEMRCGFCNLFTQSQPAADQVTAYLRTLARQMRVVQRDVRGDDSAPRIAAFAMGGGTPTMLCERQLDELLRALTTTFHFEFRDACASVETSPATATRARLALLAEHGVERISLGIQSFDDAENQALGRPQQSREVHAALETIRSLDFPLLNLDLIYGDPAQSRDHWLSSIAAALHYRPEELYLYPLYVRPETGLAKIGRPAAEHRIDLYRAGRDVLLAQGYEQLSLRCFRRRTARTWPTAYSCQSDGLIGLGCGARSYTRDLHFATRFAVTQAGIRAILNDWITQSDADLAHATHGIRLSLDEQRRRFVLLNLLQHTGLSWHDYARRFSGTPPDDLPELAQLLGRGWAEMRSGRLVLTPTGLEHSDIIGPMLYSESVRARLREFVRR